MTRLSFTLIGCLVVCLASVAFGTRVDEFAQVDKRSPTPVADPGTEVAVELKYAGMVKRQSGKVDLPEVAAGSTNPAVDPADANTFTDTDTVMGLGLNKIAPFPGGNKARDLNHALDRLKRQLRDEVDPALRKRNGLDINLISHDRPTRGLKGGLIELI